ncbi:MAG: hypothetical protein IT376_09950 [Polyangiaceae bacterium]|nr:hypothetical protein [Polyangiaceae bacterium]
MTTDRDPERLAAGGDAAPTEVAEALRGAQRVAPPPASLERIATQLEPLFAAPLPAAGLPIAAKLGVLAGAAVVAGGVWWATAAAPTPGRPATPAVSAPESPTNVAVEPARATGDPPAASPAGSAEAATSAQGEAPPQPQAGTSPSAAAKPANSGAAEVSLLATAQAALRSDPSRALALVSEHERRFPHGALVQEREVVRIEALRRLGKAGEARDRASKFERDYPDSAHRRKVRDTATAP